jgi:hypothetical protein
MIGFTRGIDIKTWKVQEFSKLAKISVDLLKENYGNNKELIDTISMAYKHNKLPHRPFNQKLWDFIEKAVTHLQKKNK